MENKIKKCSFKKHLESDAIKYCLECKINLCNKCINHHSELFDEHHLFNLDKNENEIFTGLCQEKKHNIELEYFCKTHNQLCCAACITKIKGGGNGQHTNCEICFIKEIKDEKKSKLKENIKSLESLFTKLEQSIKELKNLFKAINENKEELKLKIQKIFTKIRGALNEREDELLLEVDNQYDKLFFNEDIIIESEKLPNKIKISLEKGKLIAKENGEKENMKLNSFINDCINVEKNIKYIDGINEKIEKCNSNKNIVIKFDPDENQNDKITQFLETIKTFGKVFNGNESLIKESKIISFKEFNTIQNWLCSTIGNVKRYELIYRASVDGDSNSVSFKKCKNIPNLIWIMKDKNNNIFGCFNSIGINSNGNYSKDSKCFLYSINKNKKYNPNLNISNNIYNCSSHVIEFGNNNKFEFNIGDKFLSSNSVNFTNGEIFNHKLEICNNNTPVSLVELEVYKVIQS